MSSLTSLLTLLMLACATERAPRLRPAEAYELRPLGTPPRLSGDGQQIVVLDSNGAVWVGPADGSAALTVRAQRPEATTWWDVVPDGSACVFAGKSGALTLVPFDGGASTVLGNFGGEASWVEPLWSRDALLVAVPAAGGGLLVAEWPLHGGEPIERFRDAAADDVVFDSQLHVRFSLRRRLVHDRRGIDYDVIDLVDSQGGSVGPSFTQVPWVVDRDPVPRVGDGIIHILGGGDRVALGEVGNQGFAAVWSPAYGDATRVLVSPGGVIEAVGEDAERLLWRPIGNADLTPLSTLSQRLDADVDVLQRGPDDKLWVISAWSGAVPQRFYLWDRLHDRLQRLGPEAGPADAETWRRVSAQVIEARDGLPVTVYLTTPDPLVYGEGPWPLVAYVHGGPWSYRDTFTWDDVTQRLADRGYAVLMVEFRGTRGFGWERVHAPWDDAMIEDVNDAIDWAIGNHFADSPRLATYGRSFGAWAALRLATHANRRIQCAVAGFGPADLTVPTGHMRFSQKTLTLRLLSPSEFTDRLVGATLLFTGGRDGPNPEGTVRSFAERATGRGMPVTWVRFPMEGHGVASPANRAAMNSIIMAFLGNCLGGPPEPDLGRWEGADLELLQGGEFIPGLANAVPKRAGAEGLAPP